MKSTKSNGKDHGILNQIHQQNNNFPMEYPNNLNDFNEDQSLL